MTIPDLSATTLAIYCYNRMFYGCTKIKLSATKTGTYTQIYKIPTSGTGTTAGAALANMFANTGGTFTGTPQINTTYYLDESCSIVPEPEPATASTTPKSGVTYTAGISDIEPDVL